MSIDDRIPRLLSKWQGSSVKPSAEQLCADCPELIPQVRQMIDALAGVHSATAVGGSEETTIPRDPRRLSDPSGVEFPVAAAAEMPSHVGPYRIIAVLGSGGMGVVYKAEQRHPVKRVVALKLIKLGMDTRHVIARFESERQALALMDHPNVARVLDAGATDNGRPYFVMEFVPGDPITDYCDKNRLTTEQRLRLFAQVCDAMQHAHQKGIIHRDLKPGNILVEYRDGRAVPKVIDFGIAKATSAHLTEKTLYTEQGQLVGTPEYASPEQAETSGLDVDTRTDIYSLGVILYELLTGKLPFDPKTLRSAGYAAMQRIIREEDPPKPSTRLTKLGDDGEIESIAKKRRTEPRTLQRQIRGELDWIILKAMDKDRQRRYDSAAALSQDLERYLRDEPVSAGPPTATYRVGKFVRRHIIGLSAGAGIAAALVIGLAVAVYGLYQARAQRDRAMQASEQAAKESSHNLAVSQFLSQMLLLVNPEQAKLAEVSLQSVQARGRELFGENHVVIAAVLSSRGTALRLSGQYDEAERAFYEALAAYRKAYGPEHGTVAASLASIGAVMKDRGDYTGSESAYRQSLEMKRRLFGPRSKAAAEACQSLAEVLVLRYGPAGNDPQEMKALLFDAYQGYRESSGPKDRKTLEAMISLGVWLQRADMDTEAEPILVEAIALGPEVLGNRSELLLSAMDSKVKLYMKQKDTAAAKQSFMDLNTAVRDMFGSRNPLAMNAALQLGQYLMTVDDLGLAENVLRRAIDAAGTTVKRGDPMLTQLKGMLVEVMRRQKNVDKTALRSVWLEYLEDRQTQWGPEEPRLVPLYVDAAFVLLGWGFNSDAEGLYRHIIPMQKSAPSPNQFAIADSLLGLSKALLANNRPVDAEAAAREALDIRRRVLREGDWQIAEALAVLGECLLASGRYDEAGPLLDEASHVLDGSRLAPVEAKHRASAALVKLYTATNKPVQAAELQQKITASTQPTTAPAR